MSKRLSKKHYVAIEQAIAEEYKDALLLTKMTTEWQQDAGRFTIRSLDRVIERLSDSFAELQYDFDRDLFARLCRGEEQT